MKTAFLICALALPSLPQDLKSDYAIFRRFIEREYPEYQVVFVHPNEFLFGKKVRLFPFMVGDPPLRVWIIPKRFQESA